MKTVAYLRVSTRSQDLANQKLAILEFSQKRRFPIDQFIESRISSRQSPLERRIDEMLGTLQPGDRLLVSELSRLGRSLSQVIQIVETLVRRKIRFIAIKEAIEFDGKQDLRTKVMIALFGLFAEVERDLISERTKEGLAAAKAKGKLLGRPKGALGTSRARRRRRPLHWIGVDEVSRRKGHRYLTVVYDLERRTLLWVGEDRTEQTLREFFSELGRRPLSHPPGGVHGHVGSVCESSPRARCPGADSVRSLPPGAASESSGR